MNENNTANETPQENVSEKADKAVTGFGQKLAKLLSMTGLSKFLGSNTAEAQEKVEGALKSTKPLIDSIMNFLKKLFKEAKEVKVDGIKKTVSDMGDHLKEEMPHIKEMGAKLAEKAKTAGAAAVAMGEKGFEKAKDMAEHAVDEAKHMAEAAKDKVEAVAEKGTDKAQDIVDKAKEKAEAVADKAEEVANKATKS